MTADDDEGGYDRLREDGWAHADITARTFLDDDGRYRGAKAEVGAFDSALTRSVNTLEEMAALTRADRAELEWWRALRIKVIGLPRVGSPLVGDRWVLTPVALE